MKGRNVFTIFKNYSTRLFSVKNVLSFPRNNFQPERSVTLQARTLTTLNDNRSPQKATSASHSNSKNKYFNNKHVYFFGGVSILGLYALTKKNTHTTEKMPPSLAAPNTKNRVTFKFWSPCPAYNDRYSHIALETDEVYMSFRPDFKHATWPSFEDDVRFTGRPPNKVVTFYGLDMDKINILCKNLTQSKRLYESLHDSANCSLKERKYIRDSLFAADGLGYGGIAFVDAMEAAIYFGKGRVPDAVSDVVLQRKAVEDLSIHNDNSYIVNLIKSRHFYRFLYDALIEGGIEKLRPVPKAKHDHDSLDREVRKHNLVILSIDFIYDFLENASQEENRNEKTKTPHENTQNNTFSLKSR